VKSYLFCFVLFLGLVNGLAIQPVAAAETPAKTPATGNADLYEQLNLFGDVYNKVRDDYVEEVTDKKLMENAINGMLVSLDPHSSYMNEDDFRDMQVQTRGIFGGLGLEVTQDNGLVKVVSPIDDTPAAKAGLQPGDLITHLDGQPVMGMGLNDAVEKMRGQPGSAIKLSIRRGTKEPFDVTLTRAVIKIVSVRSRMIQDVGYLRVTVFNEQTEVGVRKAAEELKHANKNGLTGLVLDLRNNPGGLLDQAVSVSDDFLDAGEIVSTRGRKKEEGQRFFAKTGELFPNVPMVVLINGGSASAAEIVAGALQDHHRAVVVGSKSFGKGSVQTVIPLPGHGAMRLTTARYYTPSGRSIQNTGIEPDITVPPAKVELVDESKRKREADLPGALNNDQLKTQPKEGGSKGDSKGDSKDSGASRATPADDAPAAQDNSGAKDAEDYQLSRAVDLLRGLSKFQQVNGASPSAANPNASSSSSAQP
jgi:carboxyl-terminal processing protease